ncbi:carboxypeptidase regulatory-like domain-containing protein [Acidicapsa dinghuensis]|uniref:Carboxypeptidase regulatory-like domain-containing protein n=1 Tax=Acidicapsa dinghuensis TaxID=2218256 RepID=A0ABW1ENU1_9BACT|nr:TonB-dependent receptor [Acidicapsa dinghuensis]
MKRLCFWIVPLIVLGCSLSAMAQTVTGSVRGTVTDSSGAIVAGATVTAMNAATGVQTKDTTNPAGEYSIRFLQIGNYTITVEASGFNKANYGPFPLEIDQTAKVDIALKVGAASTSVEVSDQYEPILNTESATLGETFTENTIANVPLNGLDFSQLTVYTPGAVSTGFNSYGSNNSMERSTNAGNEVSVDGNRQQSNNYLLDGQEINENINNTLGYNPSPEALEQVRVIASNANAEFGNVNGGTVLAVTKSGTNSWHGSVYGFLKDYKLDANSWSNDNNPTPLPKNPYTTTQFGGTFGGPIFRDKLFFFVDYLGFRTHVGGVTDYSIAPAAFRTGDLSALLSQGIQLYDTQNINPATGQPTPYANNQIPINNPVAQYLFSNTNAYPLPNNPTTDPTGIFNNFVGPSGSFATNDQGDAKVDWHLGTRDALSFRYSQGYAEDGTTADPVPVEFPSASSYPDHFFASNWVHSFTPAIVNQFSANYGRIRFNSGVSTDPSGIFGLTGNQVVGIPSNPQQTAGFSLQNFSVSGSAGNPSSFGTNPTPEVFIDNIFGYSDALTWQKGKHLLKFGAEFIRYQQNSFYPGNDGELGQFNYNGVYVENPFQANPTPYPFADFILDRSNDVAIGAVTGRTGQRQWRDGVYVQDDWKILSNFTINLGLRWEFDQPIYEVNNKEANVNMDTGQIEYAGVNGASRALYDPTWTQFQPRIGFAYQVTPRFVVRAGYGISSYLEGTGANLRLTQNPPFHTDFEEQGVTPTGTTNAGGAVTSYSPGTFYQTSAGFPTTQVPTTTFYVWPKDLKPAITQEFSLTTEYQVAKASTIQLGYVGILGHHLTDPFWGNQLTAPGATAPYANIVGQDGVLKITQTESASNYNALQAVFRQRLTNGLELTANYTLSKSLTDDIGFYGVSNINSGQYYQQNIYDMGAEWGPAGMDTRHNISVTGVYELPFGRGKMFGSGMNSVLDEAVGGWKLSGADVYYSGFPVTVASPANYSTLVDAFTGAARPNQLRPLHVVNKSINAYYGTEVQGTSCGPNQDNGTCVYQQQPNNGFGALRPGSLRGPSFQNIDMSIAKTFKVWHEQRLDFRADFFNAFNIADYAAPDNTMTDSSFGQITGTVNNNRSTQLSLKYAF